MASSIAAITTGSGGIVSTGDSSGNLNLVSGTTTIVAVTSAGAAITGTASVSGATTLSSTLAVSGVSTFAAGTALLPALTTTGDTNTGVWFPAADTVAASTGGTERMRIDSSGNLLFNSGYGSVATAYGCRAWGLSTWSGGVPTLAASGGVSSITDAGTGNMTWNLSITLPDTNYSVFGSVGTDCIWCRVSKNSKTTTEVSFGFANPSNTAEVDPTTPVSMAIFR